MPRSWRTMPARAPRSFTTAAPRKSRSTRWRGYSCDAAPRRYQRQRGKSVEVKIKMVDQGKETPSEFFERLRQERWKEEAEAERRWMDDETIPYEKRLKLLIERDRAKEKLQKKVNAELR